MFPVQGVSLCAGRGMKKILPAIAILLTIASCGPQVATRKSFRRAEILGAWTHRDSRPVSRDASGSYSVSLTLLEDGTFEQSIVTGWSAGGQRTTGTWTLQGSRIFLSGILAEDWEPSTGSAQWTKQDVTWWFVDWHGSGQRVALFGALHPDPDAFAPWTRQP